MIRAENLGENTVVEIRGEGKDIIMEYYHIITETLSMISDDRLAVVAFVEATRDAVETALGEGEKNGQSKDTDSEASYEVRFDNLS